MKTVDATCDQTTGSVPEETKRACREADAVLFGAAGPATTAVVAWLPWEMEAWAVNRRGEQP
jgi:isocitrate/isopropylmalate dehydrogenase